MITHSFLPDCPTAAGSRLLVNACQSTGVLLLLVLLLLVVAGLAEQLAGTGAGAGGVVELIQP